MMKARSISTCVTLFVLSPIAVCGDTSKPTVENSLPAPRRISSKLVDLGKVHPIYMVAGMATLIEIPNPVTGIRTGNPDSVQYFKPDKPENEVTVVLRNEAAKPTNLILRAGKKKYVFDLIPSKSIHQDTIEVVGDFGGAEMEDEKLELIDSSDAKKAGAKK